MMAIFFLSNHFQQRSLDIVQQQNLLLERQIGLGERQIEQRLRSLGFDWDNYRVELPPEGSRTIWHFVGLRESKSADVANGWTRIDGDLKVEVLRNGDWQVHGDKQLDRVQFTVPAPDTEVAGTPAPMKTPNTVGSWTLAAVVIALVLLIGCLIVWWNWRAANRAVRNRPDNRAVRRPTRWVAALVFMFSLSVLGLTLLPGWWADHIEAARARIGTRIFEADAKLVDELVPGPTRRSEEVKVRMATGRSTPETAQVRADVFAKLLAEGSRPPGLLDEQAREGCWWPKQAMSSHYFRRGTLAGDGNVDGSLTVWRHKGVRQLGVEYNVLHGMNSVVLGATFAWEGGAPPPEATRIFLIPFSRTDGTARYLVMALEVGDGAENVGEFSKASAEQPASSGTKAEPRDAFSPVIERTVNDSRENPTDSMIDLDSGQLFSVPKDLVPQPGETPKSKKQAGEAWVRTNGIDAAGCVSLPASGPQSAVAAQIGLGGQDMLAVTTDDADWDKITAPEIEPHLAQAKLEHRGRSDMMVRQLEFPATFLFHTREGGRGILQIIGFTEKPKAVKIRYKLVQGSPIEPAKAQTKRRLELEKGDAPVKKAAPP